MSNLVSARAPLPWIALGAVLAVAVGASAVISVQLALVVVIATGFLIVAGVRPSVILIVLTVSVFVEQMAVGGLTISRFIAAVALFLVLAEGKRGRAAVRWGKPLTWACAYALWALASGLWTVEFEHTARQLGSLSVSAAYMIAFAALLRSRDQLRRLGIAFALATLGTGLLALLQYASGTTYREEGLVGDPNFFAAYQIFALPIVLALAAEARSLWLRVLLVVSVIVIIGSIFTTLSRGGILALSTVIILMLVAPARAIFRSYGQKLGTAALVTIGLVVALTISFGALSARYTSLVEGKEATGSGRLNEWKAASRSISERPILGLGYGAFVTVSNDLVRTTPGTDLVNFDLRPQGTEAHSAYLGSAAELGIPGAFLFVGLIVSTGLALRRTAASARTHGDPSLARFANALLLSLIGWCIASIFLESETARPLWILVGLALALPRLLPEAEREEAPSRRPALVLWHGSP